VIGRDFIGGTTWRWLLGDISSTATPLGDPTAGGATARGATVFGYKSATPEAMAWSSSTRPAGRCRSRRSRVRLARTGRDGALFLR